LGGYTEKEREVAYGRLFGFRTTNSFLELYLSASAVHKVSAKKLEGSKFQSGSCEVSTLGSIFGFGNFLLGHSLVAVSERR